jgi:nitroimidazol reductase NimA-like FMN-containing flavoprotein (pyridoxamine 5'-phosphate oxidase superfamily)
MRSLFKFLCAFAPQSLRPLHLCVKNSEVSMSIDYANRELTAVRRNDREVTDEAWIRTLLHRAPVGYLATLHGDQPFINSNLFVYDEDTHVIFMHTARKGRTQANISENGTEPPPAERPKVCFTVTEMGRLLPADVALEFSIEYKGVVVFGRGETITDPDEAAAALQKLLDKYAPHLKPNHDYRPVTAEELKRTAVFRITIEEWSGKKKEVADDFPGAFYYEA